ncbi:hypothetical protein ACP4OV_016773 [Aristida adscensionis]
MLGFHGPARLLGPGSRPSPGIFVGGAFHWTTRRYGHRRILSYDMASECAWVFSGPPEADVSRQRFSVMDPELKKKEPHAVQGVHSVWTPDAHHGWRLMQEEVVVTDGVSMTYSRIPYGIEVPFDFAGASTSDIIVQKNGMLRRLDLQTGETPYLTDLYLHQRGRMAALYTSFDIFAMFL